MFSRNFFHYLLRLYLLGMLFLFLLRLFFIAWHFTAIVQPGFISITETFLIGALFDSCVLCCTLFFAMLVSVVLLPLFKRSTLKFFVHFSNVLLALVFFVNLADIFYFNQYGVRFNMFAGEAVNDPKKILSTAWKIYPVLRILLFYAVFLLVFVRLHARLRRKFPPGPGFSYPWAGASVLLLAALSFLYYGPPLWTLSCFSGSSALNQASLNGVYTFVKSWQQQRIYDNDIPSFHFYTDDVALETLRDSVVKKNESLTDPLNLPLLRSCQRSDSFQRKNVVIIILESFGSRYIGKLNEGKGFSPYFDRYADSGMFFTRFRSNGPRTQNGIMSTVSGFPAILGVNLQRRKGVNEFHTLGNILLAAGYRTQFLHNGHADYDDMDKFMRQGGFQSQLDVNDYSRWKMKNEWGVSDQDLYEKAYDMIWSGDGKPVLSVMLTMSNHEPHELPEEFRRQHPEVKSMDAKQATFYYSDWALGNFLDKCSRHPQYRNTIFVVLADHGDAYGPEDNVCKIFHIPCLILNAKQGKGVVSKAASQCDIPSTLLGELNYPGAYPFIGQDVFAEGYKPYVFMRAYGNDMYFCRDSIMLKYYFETDKGEFYYLDKHHYQRPANDVPGKTQEQMIAFSKKYMQAICWIFRNGRYRER